MDRWERIESGWLERLAGEFGSGSYPFNSRSNVYENSRVVKAGPGTLFGVCGFNSKGSSQWIQIHDSGTPPANGAVPELIIYVATVSNFSVSYVIPGRAFNQGIYIVNSSTGPTLTIGSADCWFDAQFV